MKKLAIVAVAAVALAWALWPSQASAAWAYRTVYRYDPYCGKVVAFSERYWIPDCDHVRPYPYSAGYGYGYGGLGYGRIGYDTYRAPFAYPYRSGYDPFPGRFLGR